MTEAEKLWTRYQQSTEVFLLARPIEDAIDGMRDTTPPPDQEIKKRRLT
jgi:hypothetical protein